MMNEKEKELRSKKNDIKATVLVLSVTGADEKTIEDFIVKGGLNPETPEELKDALRTFCRKVYDVGFRTNWSTKMEILFGSIEKGLNFLEKRKNALAKEFFEKEAEDDKRD